MNYAEKLAEAEHIIELHNQSIQTTSPRNSAIETPVGPKPTPPWSEIQTKLIELGASSEENLAACTWEDLESCGIPRILARRIANTIFRRLPTEKAPEPTQPENVPIIATRSEKPMSIIEMENKTSHEINGATETILTNGPIFKLGCSSITEEDLLSGVICTGLIGAGKTTGFIFPILQQMLEQYNEKNNSENCGGLIIDSKGEILDVLITMMKNAGRDPHKDIIVIDPSSNLTSTYNMINPESSHFDVAARFKSVLLSMNNSSVDTFWFDCAEKLIANAVALIRLAHSGTCTLNQISKLITEEKYVKENIHTANSKLNSSEVNLPDDKYKAADYFKAQEQLLEDVTRYFTQEWANMAVQSKAGVVCMLSNSLFYWLTESGFHNAFCQDTNFSLMDTCNRGKIIVFNLKGSETTRQFLAAALKVDFQHRMKNRYHYSKTNTTRRVFLICEDFQDIITDSETIENDASSFAVSRQSKTINLITAQSYEQLYKRAKRLYVSTVLECLKVKVCFNSEDKETAKHMAKISESEIAESEIRQLQINKNGFSEAIVYKKGTSPRRRSAHKVEMPLLWINTAEREANKKEWQERKLILLAAA